MRDPFNTADILQEGVAAALATLHAVNAGDLLASLPADPADAVAHTSGTTLLDMLYTHLNDIQSKADALDAARVAASKEGR